MLDMVPVDTSPVAGTKLDVDDVNTVCVDDGEWAGARVRTRVTRAMTELNALADLSEAAVFEKCPRPFLRTRQ